MVSVVIPTNESEHLLVRTLACLVSGATAGLIREVILADSGSTDDTARVGDVAGCKFMRLPGPLGPRLSAAAHAARGQWLLFLRPGCVLQPGWVDEVTQFLESAPDGIAASFAPAPPRPQMRSSLLQELMEVWRSRRAAPSPERGLLISRQLYREMQGHADLADPEADLLRRIGKRRIAMLRTGASLHAERKASHPEQSP